LVVQIIVKINWSKKQNGGQNQNAQHSQLLWKSIKTIKKIVEKTFFQNFKIAD
jgi:hypothetical protein